MAEVFMKSPGGVLCSGNMVYDTLARPVEGFRFGATTIVDTIEHHLGGNGALTCLTLAALGVRTRLLAGVGRDPASSFVLETLRGVGVDLSGIQVVDAPTSATVAIVNAAGDRAFLHRPGASTKVFGAPIEFTPERLDGMAHYHMASPFVVPLQRPHMAETLVRARAAGLTTSLDTNWDSAGRWMEDLAPTLPHLDILFANEDEARMITGHAEPANSAACLLSRGVRVAVLKLGCRGCAIYTAGTELRCPAFEVEGRDSTGAGDCFAGAFLAGLAAGATLEEAGRIANAVGALTVEEVGGDTGVLRLAGMLN